MNTDSQRDDPLDAALNSWAVNDPLPPGFRQQVWSRIAQAERTEASWFSTAVERLIAGLRTPRIAYRFAVGLMAFGIIGGALAAQVKTSRMDDDLGRRYLAAVDPYLHTVAAK